MFCWQVTDRIQTADTLGGDDVLLFVCVCLQKQAIAGKTVSLYICVFAIPGIGGVTRPLACWDSFSSLLARVS